MEKFAPILAGMPHMLHGGDYNPEQWADQKETIWKEDMRLAKLAGINTLSVGIFSWGVLEPEDGKYDFSLLDEVMDMLAENGIKAILATPSGARPPWLAEKYPEVLRVNEDRSRNRFGGRHNHCLTSPVYRRKAAAINEALAERYKDHPALGMWHISNEYSGQCHCELCQEKFREFLRRRYGTLEALNHAWWTTFWAHNYSDWSQIESPGCGGETSMPGLEIAWLRFNSEQFADFIRAEREPLRRITPDIPCTANFMRLYTELDYTRLAKELDIISWDNYPQLRNDSGDWLPFCESGFVHDWMRSMKNRPFMMMESSPSTTNWQPVAKLRRPGVTHLYGMQAVAHGSDSVQYFQFRKGRGSAEQHHGAVVDHVGHENTRVFRETAKTGEVLSKLDDLVGAPVPARAALIFDTENEWALCSARGFVNNGDPDKGYKKTLLEHYRALKHLGLDVDIVDSTADLTRYDFVSAPMLYMLRTGVGEKLKSYVAQGGTLVMTYLGAMVDEEGLCYTGGFPGELMNVFGIWNEEIDCLYDTDRNAFRWNGREYGATDFCELIHERGAQVQSRYLQDFYADMPVVTRNHYEQGYAWYLAAHGDENFLRDFYANLALKTGVPVTEGLPEGVYLCRRETESSRYLFCLNVNDAEKEMEIPPRGRNALTGEALAPFVTLAPHGYLIAVYDL